MSIVLAKELRIELDYGIDFIGKALEDGMNKKNAIGKLIEARSAMASYISALQNKDYFARTMRGPVSNNVIEMDPDVVDDESLSKNITPSVEQIKACIGGINLGLEKVMRIRFTPQSQMVPVNSYKALRSVDRMVDSLEGCIGYLHNELQYISKRYPGMYPTFEVEEKTPAATEKTIPSEAIGTNAIMEGRATEGQGNSNLAEEKKEDAQNFEYQKESESDLKAPEDEPALYDPNSVTHNPLSDPTPSDPTEGFSEQPGSDQNTTERQ